MCVNSAYGIKITMKKFVEIGKYILLGLLYIQHDFAEKNNNIFYISINKHLINYPNFFDDLLQLCHMRD